MSFEPIAIVGRGCVLPGALTPQALWDAVVAGRSLVGRAAPDRWGLPRDEAMGTTERSVDRTWSDAGGYVEGFEQVFDPSGFAVPAEQVAALDPLFQWVLHAGREALREAGLEGGAARAGLVLGNLSFPSAAMARYAEAVWLGGDRPDALNRFNSGLPAQLAATALGLGGEAFALDAACASSLYAIKLACDRLHDRQADVMLAGAVNRADDLFIHVGFCALSAMSRSGQSRPFHREADGLVPAEGAGIVVLKRLDDAVAAGDRILGVIRGVGLSNDGRGRGFLAPAEEGQLRAMRAAYAQAGLSPREISLVECHATGTPVGDATELKSMAALFEGAGEVPIGSLKSNLGHLITAAGAAGLLKVLAAMEAGIRPPTLHTDAPVDALRNGPFRLLTKAEPWDGPRRAAISAFGFGGNNAHLLVEQWDPAAGRATATRAASASVAAGVSPAGAPVAAGVSPAEIAVVAVEALVSDGHGVRDVLDALVTGTPRQAPRATVDVALEGIRFPPNDLKETLPQQLLVLEAARKAAAGLDLPRDRTAVLVGMGVDAEIARYGARWRLGAWARSHGVTDEAWLASARDAIQTRLVAAGVVGTMPNIPANRINQQLDLAGPSFTVSAEELSGDAALQVAARALRHGELDAAVVGAVDLSHEPVHRAALQALGVKRAPGDAAVVLVLERREDAERNGHRVLAVLEDDGGRDARRHGEAVEAGVSPASVGDVATGLFGHPHAATGLLQVATAALAVAYGLVPHVGRPADPWLGERVARCDVTGFAGPRASVTVRGVGAPRPVPSEGAPRLRVYAGADKEAVLAALAAGSPPAEGGASVVGEGPARLVFVATHREWAAKAEQARRWLGKGGPQPDGVAFAERPIGGEVALVFAGAGAAYRGMGRELLLALPELAERLSARTRELPSALDWAWASPADGGRPATERAAGRPASAAGTGEGGTHPLEQLWSASALCQLHAELTLGLLGLKPTATIGYSSGESNALFATGAWRDLDGFVRDCGASAVFTTDLVGEFAAPKRAWGDAGAEGAGWAASAVAAPVAAVRAALADEPLAHLAIVNAPDDVVVAGEVGAVGRVVERLGVRAVPLGYDIAAHVPEVEVVRDAWWKLHHREVHPVPGVRFYTAATGASYAPTSDAAADAITGQAVTTLDFPRVIEQAWQDGVRVFVEHGPRGLCSGWIRRVLGDREHVVVPLDVQGRSGVRQALHAVATLVAAGVPVDAEALLSRLAAAAPPEPAKGPALTLPAHPPEVRLPALPKVPAAALAAPPVGPSVPASAGVQVMAPAPWLPPVLDEAPAPSAPTGAPAKPSDLRTRVPAASAPAVPSAPSMAPAPQVASAPASALAAALPVAPSPAELLDAPRVASGGLAEVVSSVGAFHAHLAEVHRQYVAQQQAAHEQFLALRQSTLDHLMAAYAHGGAPAPHAPVPLPLAAPPAPSAPDPATKSTKKNEAHEETLRARSHEETARPAPAAPAGAPPPQPDPRDLRVYPVNSVSVRSEPTDPVLPGPKFDRKQLEVLASGRISSVFGTQFAPQDGYFRQVRMPEPPLLLADRVTGIDAVPLSMKTGTMWTETDVRPDSWYLHEGRMPAGIHIESGQADLLLISWLGVDMLNKSERAYRLLGCELTWHEGDNGVLPAPGDTLKYDIHLDGHANQGAIRLMFFHYDCKIDGKPRLTVRGGQAGFFTDEELAASGGILWTPETGEHSTEGPLDPPAVRCEKSSFTREEVRAYADGHAFECFGPGWEATQAHVRTPGIQTGRMLFLDEVVTFDPRGGPWKRGYLRAEQPIHADDWFFKGHFKNDPCMPGTLMFEGCVQAMAFYLAAMGFTLDRDGWRFEPVPEQKYLMRCRGQVIPTSKNLTYEVFVEEVVAGPIPMVFADLLCTVDGLKAFHARRVGLRLVPDWPLATWKHGQADPDGTGGLVANKARVHGGNGDLDLRKLGGMRGWREPKPVATSPEGFPFDYASLLACAWGKPSTAFGPIYERFDGTRRVARLPGPPYHFMSRITKTEGPMGGMQAGSAVEVEYDVPRHVWYFDENGHPVMPFCVLMEAALQPCGWLASYVGCALTTDIDLMFRNLDGTGTLHREIRPGETLITRSKLTNVSKSAGMIIVNFEVECRVGDEVVYDMKTVFGFFPKEAFDNQAGLPVTPDERARFEAPANVAVDLGERPARYFGAPRLANPMLLMVDRVVRHEPEGGKAGLGWWRAEKDVNPAEWFFKAHFFQDPVQPGSLGVEALCQLLQIAMIDRGMAEGVANARFEPVAVGKPTTWKYRGQVVPKNRLIGSEVEIVEVGEDERGRYAVAEASLWVDGKRIYHVKNLGMRIVAGEAATAAPDEEVLDADVDTWLGDHRPTWTMPAMPAMSMVDRLATGVRPPLTITEVQVKRWLPFPGGPVRLQTTREGDKVVLSAWREAQTAALSRFEPVCEGVVRAGDPGARPEALPALDVPEEPDPYASGALFHGPAFQYLVSLRMGSDGASAVLDAAKGSVPRGALHQGLLDAITHAIPHDDLHRWSPEIGPDLVAYPYRVPRLRIWEALPDEGQVRVEVRFAGFAGDPRFPAFDAQVIRNGTVIAEARIVEVLLPKGPIGTAPREARIAFLRDHRYVPGVALSRVGETTTADAATVKQSDWLPGNVARIYGVPSTATDLVAQVAVRDHVAARAFVHPASLSVSDGLDAAVAAVRPLRRHPVRVERDRELVSVTDAGPPVQDLTPVKRWWDDWFQVGRWPVEDVYYGLIERFVGDVVVADPEAFAKVHGRSCLYLGNHQVGIESLLFSVLASALSGVSTVTLAKAEHRTTWIGKLIAHSFTYPGVRDPKVITFFDREDRAALLQIVGEIAMEMATVGKGAMVHVEGTRSLECRTPVLKMSSAFIDMALQIGAPIVPVKFVGGLPVEPLTERIEYPVGYGRQDYWLGRPILPEELAAMPLKERKAFVIDAMNGLGPAKSEETPYPGDPAFAAAVQEWHEATGASMEHSALFVTLRSRKNGSEDIQRLLEGAREGKLVVGAGERDRWLAELARRLFGDRGPRVVER